jgi:hypothetical protein
LFRTPPRLWRTCVEPRTLSRTQQSAPLGSLGHRTAASV